MKRPFGRAQDDPFSMFMAMNQLGLTGGGDYENAMRDNYRNLLSGLNPEFVNAVIDSMDANTSWQKANRESESEIAGLPTPFVLALASMAAGGAMSAFGGGAAGAGSASSGGTAAAEGAGGLAAAEAGGAAAGGSGIGGGALGSGLTPGVSATGIGGGALGSGLTAGTSATGIGGGALGTGITAGGAALAGAGALAPGSFVGETLYPVVGGASGTTGVGGATSGIGSAAGQAGGGVLSRILSGNGTADDYLDLLGRAAPGVLGAIASNRQAGAFEDLANKYMAFGAPSRARFEASFSPGFTMVNEPGYKDALDQTTKSFLHKASVAGNPVDSPNAWSQTLNDVNATFAFPALQNYRQLNANTGGLASFAPAAVNANNSAINAQGNVFNAIGAGAADIFNPPRTLAQILKEARL